MNPAEYSDPLIFPFGLSSEISIYRHSWSPEGDHQRLWYMLNMLIFVYYRTKSKVQRMLEGMSLFLQVSGHKSKLWMHWNFDLMIVINKSLIFIFWVSWMPLPDVVTINTADVEIIWWIKWKLDLMLVLWKDQKRSFWLYTLKWVLSWQ